MQTVDHREERPSYYILSIGTTILKTRDADPILLKQYWPTVGPPSASLGCVGLAPLFPRTCNTVCRPTVLKAV